MDGLSKARGGLGFGTLDISLILAVIIAACVANIAAREPAPA
jgi:hypothetical protein